MIRSKTISKPHLQIKPLVSFKIWCLHFMMLLVSRFKFFLFIISSTSILTDAQMLSQEISNSTTKALQIHSRLTSKKISVDSTVIKNMAELIKNGSPLAAARLATDDPSFYTQTLVLVGAKISNREGIYRQSLNDLSAMFIGFAKDDRDARELLTTNDFYIFQNLPNVRSKLSSDILKSNNHYADVDMALANNPLFDLRPFLTRIPLQILTQQEDTEKSLPEIIVKNPDPAGILSTRQFVSDCADAGTNRRCYEKVIKNLTCHSLEEVMSTSLPDDRIGRDVSRAPGKDPETFLLTCKGCHSNMDAQRSAFAFIDFNDGQLKHGQVNSGGQFNSTTRVANKLNQLGEGKFSQGIVISSDEWVNYAITPEFRDLYGWRDQNGQPINTPYSSRGLQSYGLMISRSEAFSRCMAQTVFESLCRRNLTSEEKASDGYIRQIAQEWEKPSAGAYKLRWLFEKIATTQNCLGGS